MGKKIYIVINPASGKDEPILSYINQAFKDKGTAWEEKIVHEGGDVFKAVKEVMEDALLVAVYGGDGTICEAAKALHGKGVAMAILPGGTANIMAKELNIPLDTKEAIDMIADGGYMVNEVDMGLVNGCPFLLRINLGVMADMVTETSAEMKQTWGQWAYGITAFQHLQQEGSVFNLTIDGEEFVQQSVALTITNAGNIGMKGLSFLQGISVTDGLLDVIALDKADLLSVLKVTSSILLHNDSPDLKHWKVKEVIIKTGAEIHYLCDDEPKFANELRISVSPASLKVLVPKIADK